MRDWLKTARTERHLTMKEMGCKLGISESYYCSIENGTRQVSMDIGLAAAIAVILEIPIARIAQLEAEWKNQSAAYPDRTAAGNEGRASSSAATAI